MKLLTNHGSSFHLYLVVAIQPEDKIKIQLSFILHLMDLIPEWRPINYSFVCMLISPLSLILTSKFFCFLYMLTRQGGLINMQTKESFIGRHFGIRSITECKLMQHKRKSAVKCNFERLQSGEFIFLQVCQRTEILQIQQSDWFCERALFLRSCQPTRAEFLRDELCNGFL